MQFLKRVDFTVTKNSRLFNMCEQQYYDWSTSFYHHYLNQHAIMTQYVQQLNQSTSAGNSCHTCRTCHWDSYNPVSAHYRPAVNDCCSCTSENSTSESCSYTTTTTTSEYEVEEEDTSEIIDEDEDESDCEYVLNVDAILAMRAAKEELSKASKSSETESDSIVLLDYEKEDFEFVELGNSNSLTSKLACSVGTNVNKKEEFENRKKIMDYLYGEKSATIGGLETAMAVHFEHLCDNHQPPLWPVLPVRL